MRIPLVCVFCMLLLATGRLGAQGLEVPDTWRWVTDRPARVVTESGVPDSAFRFVAMPPGWHITMGPGGVLYDPGAAIGGRFTVEAVLVRFPGESDGEYGVFVGGRDLDGADPSYTAFVLRRDGSSAVIRGGSGDTGAEFVVPWTRHEAVVPHAGSGTVKNVVTVVSQGPDLSFRVNGTEVASLDGDMVPSEGIVGFRIGQGVDLHITSLDLTRHLAPARNSQ